MRKSFFVILFILISAAILTFVYFTKKRQGEEFVFWTIQLKPVAVDFIQKNIAVFQKKHPNVKIVWVDIPIAEAQKRTLASILGGNPPDLINLNPDFSTLLAQRGALEYFSEAELGDFHPSLVNILKFDDNIFGVPFYATSSLTLYNKGCIKNSEIPKTYADILNVQKGVCTNAFAINLNENDTLAKILNKYGVYDFKSSENILKTKEIFDMFQKMYKENIIPKDSFTINHREVVERYMSEGAAVVVVGANFIKMLQENAPDVYAKTGVAPQLTGDEGFYDISLMNFVIPKKAKNKDMAREFLFLLTNKENQLEFSKLTNVLPANYHALEDEFFKCNNSKNLIDIGRCTSARQLENLGNRNFGYKNKKAVNDALNKALETYVLQNNQKALQNAADEVKALQDN